MSDSTTTQKEPMAQVHYTSKTYPSAGCMGAPNKSKRQRTGTPRVKKGLLDGRTDTAVKETKVSNVHWSACKRSHLGNARKHASTTSANIYQKYIVDNF